MNISVPELLAVIFSIIYVILAARENILCWPAGLIAVSISLIVYVNSKLYADASLQIYYIGMSLYGWYHWSAKGKSQSQTSIVKWPIRNHLLAIAAGFLVSGIVGYLFSLTDAALPYIDAFTSAFSILATFMVAWKLLENWIYWIVIDIVCIFVYINREIYLFALLFFIYTVIAVIGYFAWKKKMLKPL